MWDVVLIRMRGALLLGLLTFALVATGFAHRAPGTADATLDAFVMAGGNLTDLCGDSDGDGTPDRGDCPACTAVGALILPGAAPSVRAVNYRFVASVVAPRESRAVRAVHDPAHGLRAPPLA